MNEKKELITNMHKNNTFDALIARKLIWYKRCGLVKVYLLGYFFSDKTIRSRTYQNMLKEKLMLQIRSLYEKLSDLFQQDWVPDNFAKAEYTSQWIGKKVILNGFLIHQSFLLWIFF